MAEIVDAAILEVAHAATRIWFDAERVAKDRLRLPARLKGGGIRSMEDIQRPAFLGALLDVLPRCIDIVGSNGEKYEGIYSKLLSGTIGEGAYDVNATKNANFLGAKKTLGPSLKPCDMHGAMSSSMRPTTLGLIYCKHRKNGGS